MEDSLTVRDLLLPGEPLDPGEVLAGEDLLGNTVLWVVSLRPYPPAFPRLRGGELALVAAEHLSRLDPPTTLADVVRHLSSLKAAAVAVRGEVTPEAVSAARETALPLIHLQPDSPLPDIEQAVMRECALYQARREMVPSDPNAWLEELLEGRLGSTAEAQQLARKHGVTIPPACAVLLVATQELLARRSAAHEELSAGGEAILSQMEVRLRGLVRSARLPLISAFYQGALILLGPGAALNNMLPQAMGKGTGAGLGTEYGLADVARSLVEARVAATGSALLFNGQPLGYSTMGADVLLVTLFQEHPEELTAFVDRTLGPVLRHDESASTQLLPTLSAYVEHGGKLRETAAAIYVHRNTLAYRLERAAEILRVDLKSAPTRLSLEIALRSLPLVRALERAPS